MDLEIQVTDTEVTAVEHGIVLGTGLVHEKYLEIMIRPDSDFVRELFFIADSPEQLQVRMNVALEGIKQAAKFYKLSPKPSEFIGQYLETMKLRGYISGYASN